MRRSKHEPSAPFWPFMCSPTAREQMAVLLGDGFSADQRPAFMQKLFDGTARSVPGDIRLRIFDFNGSVVFAVIFVTDAAEPASGRDGLMLAVGFGVTDFAYLETETAAVILMEFLIDDLTDQLGQELFGTGAKTLIEHNLRLSSPDPELEKTAILFRNASQIAAAILPPAASRWARFWRGLKWSRGRSSVSRPRYLLLLDGDIEGPFEDAFQALTHEALVRLRTVDQSASTALDGGLSEEITIRRLALGSDAGKIASCILVKDASVPYLALYT